MKIGMVGLGRMGGNMVERLRRDGHEVIGYSRSNTQQAKDLTDLVSQLPTPRVVWLMVPSGNVTQRNVDEMMKLLEPGDVLIDGGNSNFRDSIRRASELEAQGILWADCGTSGGIWGLTEGYSLMVGASPDAFGIIEPLCVTLAPPNGYAHVGAAGAGHFVKMVHNGIEYGMMQSFAEGFEIMRASKEFELDLHQVAQVWQQGSVVRSWLLDLAASAFEKDPDLTELKGFAEDSGEGRWTVLEAVNSGVAAPAISAALYARFVSQQEDSFAMKVVAALRREFGGHAVKAE